jgi:hypothetical protein
MRMRAIIVLIMLFIIPLFNSNFAPSNAFGQDESETYIYLVDSEPLGIPYYKWTESWWNWLVSIPSDSNPALDMDSKECTLSSSWRDH